MLPPTSAPLIRAIANPGVINPLPIEGGACPIFTFNDSNSTLCAIDLVFDGGHRHTLSPVLAGAVSQLLLTATSNKNAEEIADAFDHFGAYTQCSAENYYSRVTLFCLEKFLPNVLDLFVDCFNDQVFDDKELEFYKLRKIQSLKIAEQKTSFLARKALNENLFGKEHFLGITSTANDAEDLTKEQCSQFFNEFYSLKYIVATGPINDSILHAVKKTSENIARKRAISASHDGVISASNQRYMEIARPDAVQCTLAMGLRTIDFQHPDYIKLQITNTLLGGFFGSRLMKNIREDKGYTYGISSSVFSMEGFSILGIGADLKKESFNDACSEIFFEIERLKNEAISDEELQVLRSYLQGSIIHRMDNITALAGMFISLREKNADMNYYTRYFQCLSSITGEDINSIAATYLLKDSFYTVVAGV